ncbi:MAG TPA: ATPase domain-containing protein [Reyranella sp.]|nr:ATPase domain-containing protein [Reyranella sp.]
MSGAKPKARTGVPGLDEILLGGLAAGRLFLLEGCPGTGKTTVALSFLLEGAKVGERGLYITFSETEHELRVGAQSHGWELGDKIEICEIVPPESLLDSSQHQSLLYSSDLELGETTKLIFDAIERSKAVRIVIDSLSELRLLAQSSLRYRRQILALKHYFARHGSTVLLLDDLTSDSFDKTVHSVAAGVIQLEEMSPDYGGERRRARVVKYRAQGFRGGYHDFVIRRGGAHVFPRLVAAEHRRDFKRGRIGSGVPGLDALLGGGVERGSSTLLIGPAGAGKSLITLQFVAQAIRDGGKAAMFIFDEELGLLFDRAKPLGFDLAALQAGGRLAITQLDAAELSPGEFAHRVRESVRDGDVSAVVIDSLNGYQASMPQENSLILHMHELLQFCNRQGVSTFLTVAQHGLVGDMKSPVDITYLADAVIMLRFFEARGAVRRAISVIKKRTGKHEDTIREFWIDGGLHVGEPLVEFHGVLRGTPVLHSDSAPARPAIDR